MTGTSTLQLIDYMVNHTSELLNIVLGVVSLWLIYDNRELKRLNSIGELDIIEIEITEREDRDYVIKGYDLESTRQEERANDYELMKLKSRRDKIKKRLSRNLL